MINTGVNIYIINLPSSNLRKPQKIKGFSSFYSIFYLDPCNLYISISFYSIIDIYILFYFIIHVISIYLLFHFILFHSFSFYSIPGYLIVTSIVDLYSKPVLYSIPGYLLVTSIVGLYSISVLYSIPFQDS